MPSPLAKKTQIWKLARDLGIRPSDNSVADILEFCERKVRKFLKDFPECTTLADLLEFMANKLGTSFELVHTDADLRRLRSKYVRRGEKDLRPLEAWLAPNVFGVTFRMRNPEPWESQFVSIIDCRGEKTARSYFTKWHELSHLLVLTDQTRLSFRRTHCDPDLKDPEESLVDIIAGVFGFHGSIVRKYAKGDPSFENFEDLRLKLCPEASLQASLIGFVAAWPKACVLVRAELALKKDEKRRASQLAFGFREAPTPTLRAVNVTPNESAREAGLNIYPNMRVPERSVIHTVFTDGIPYAEAVEDLSWWEASGGLVLPQCKIRVKARRAPTSVEALIVPLAA